MADPLRNALERLTGRLWLHDGPDELRAADWSAALVRRGHGWTLADDSARRVEHVPHDPDPYTVAERVAAALRRWAASSEINDNDNNNEGQDGPGGEE